MEVGEGPLSAVVATLFDIGWNPVLPDCWQMPECEGGDAWKITGKGSLHDFTKAINISCNRLLWQELPGGQPQLKVLRKHLNYLMKAKKDADYGMLLCIASGGRLDQPQGILRGDVEQQRGLLQPLRVQ